MPGVVSLPIHSREMLMFRVMLLAMVIVVFVAVADLNGDGKPLLFFAFAFGSGEHRSMIAAVDCRAKEPAQLVAPLVNYNFGRDYVVKADGATAVEVFAGKEKIGKLALEKKE